MKILSEDEPGTTIQYKASISMQNKQECFAWGVGLCQLFKEPLVHSMHLYFTVLEQGQQLDTPTNGSSNSTHLSMRSSPS